MYRRGAAAPSCVRSAGDGKKLWEAIVGEIPGVHVLKAEDVERVRAKLASRIAGRWGKVGPDYGNPSVRREVCKMLHPVLISVGMGNYKGAVQFKRAQGRWLMSVLIRPIGGKP